MRISFLAATVLLATITIISAQNFDLAGFRSCARLSEERFCTDNLNVVQSILDMAVNCNDPRGASFVANECVQDSQSGLRCGAVYAYVRDISALATNTCIPTILGGDCTPECRRGLEAIRGDLGCCINAMVNHTNSFYAAFSSVFTYDLWSRCGVELPDSTCSGALSFTLPGSRQPSCKSAQSLGCSQSIEEAIVDSIRGNSNCGNILQYYMDSCSQREDGDYCITTLEEDINTLVGPMLAACGPSLFTQPRTCPSNCKTLLERFIDERGCCVNSLFNSSTFAAVAGTDFAAPVLAANNIQLCEVEPPPLTCGSLPFRVPFFTLLIPLIIATVFGRK